MIVSLPTKIDVPSKQGTAGGRLVFASLAMMAGMLLVGQTCQAAGPKPTALKKGDRVVFLGDSITQAGERPGGYIRLVREAVAAKSKDLGVTVIGAGISGHKVPDLEKRLDRDVIRKKPTVVVIYIGINDVWHSTSGRGTSKEDFDRGLRRLIQRINTAGARVILCTPSVIGEKTVGENKLDKMLDEYSAISRKVAAETKSQMLDLRKLFIAHLKTSNTGNKGRGVLTSDGVHLNQTGNRFVADQMLEALAVNSPTSRLLRHVVMFKFKDDLTPKQVQEAVDAFRALPSKIAEIHDFEYGLDVSVENKTEGFTHCFQVTFRSEKDRATYLPHPAHQEFIKLAGPRIDKVLVVDYWTGK